MSKNGVEFTVPSGWIIFIFPPCSTAKSRWSLACCKLKGFVKPVLKTSTVMFCAKTIPDRNKKSDVVNNFFIAIFLKLLIYKYRLDFSVKVSPQLFHRHHPAS